VHFSEYQLHLPFCPIGSQIVLDSATVGSGHPFHNLSAVVVQISVSGVTSELSAWTTATLGPSALTTLPSDRIKKSAGESARLDILSRKGGRLREQLDIRKLVVESAS
jgi:hypothetical protein